MSTWLDPWPWARASASSAASRSEIAPRAFAGNSATPIETVVAGSSGTFRVASVTARQMDPGDGHCTGAPGADQQDDDAIVVEPGHDVAGADHGADGPGRSWTRRSATSGPSRSRIAASRSIPRQSSETGSRCRLAWLRAKGSTAFKNVASRATAGERLGGAGTAVLIASSRPCQAHSASRRKFSRTHAAMVQAVASLRSVLGRKCRSTAPRGDKAKPAMDRDPAAQRDLGDRLLGASVAHSGFGCAPLPRRPAGRSVTRRIGASPRVRINAIRLAGATSRANRNRAASTTSGPAAFPVPPANRGGPPRTGPRLRRRPRPRPTGRALRSHPGSGRIGEATDAAAAGSAPGPSGPSPAIARWPGARRLTVSPSAAGHPARQSIRQVRLDIVDPGQVFGKIG